MSVAQKLRCHVEQMIDYGDHVYTVDLEPERLVPRFRPGQFLHLALDDYDPSGFWPESRVFSIASSPSRRERLRITYSVRGRFTARMEKELRQGRSVWVKLPYGEFVVDPTNDVVLFAGGTGITAFTAFLDSLTSEFGHRVYLAYGARRGSLLIYRDRIEERAKVVPQLHRFYFIERDEDQGDAVTGEPDETVGSLSVAAVWPSIKDPFRAIYYLSGPPLMLKAISKNLHDLKIKSEAIRIDAWE